MDSKANFLQRKAAFEEAATALIGQQIMSVRYYQLKSDIELPRWNFASSQFHVLDFGVEFELSSGKLFSLTWGSEFYPYGLSIGSDSLKKQIIDPAIWDVSHDASWSLITNSQVESVNVYWAWWASQRHDEVRHHYPQDIEICFDRNCSIFVGAYVYMSDGTLFPSGDELIIFFDHDIARTYLIGPYNPMYGVE